MEYKKDNSRKTLLLVYNYNRGDFLSYFQTSKADFNFFFAEFASPDEVYNQQFQEFGQAIYWGDFKHAFDLLEKIKPDKVLFLYIESYFHMALNIACKEKGIPTYLLDHGWRDINAQQIIATYSNSPPVKSNHYFRLEKILQIAARVKARLFLARTYNILSTEAANALKEFCRLRKKESYLSVYKKLNHPIYQANEYLAISPCVAKEHKKVLNCVPDKISYFGIPTFDHLAILPKTDTQLKSILFIDQGLVTAGLLKWTQLSYNKFTEEFSALCASRGYSVYVKKHPRQSGLDWALLAQEKKITIIDDEALAALLPEAGIIVGFFSTYLLPLVAMAHTTILTLENHPAGRLDVSKSFIDAGVAHPIYDLQDLVWAFDHIEQLHQQQLPNKAKFTEDWLYKFDGKSGERLRDILLQDDL